MEEVVYFASDSMADDEVSQELDRLQGSGLLFCIGDYYSVRSNFESLIARRVGGEKHAQDLTDKAYRRARLIGKFPYVKGAYISGSMSKGVMLEDGDVDFFIITEPGRLWVARTLLVLFKKTFLFNSHKFFCLNYFIDSGRLEIEEKNLFTAVEAATLKPIFDRGVYHDFHHANRWVEQFIPNRTEQEVVYNGETGRSIASVVEALLNNKLGDRLDRVFMNITLKVWKKKFKDMVDTDFDVALKTRTYVSKHHPRNFQSRVLTALDDKVRTFEDEHQIKLG